MVERKKTNGKPNGNTFLLLKTRDNGLYVKRSQIVFIFS